MSQEMTLSVDVVTCADCGMSFGVPKDWLGKRRADHVNFYCPAGHANHYPGKTEAERLKAQLEDTQRVLAEERADMAKKLKDATKKGKKR